MKSYKTIANYQSIKIKLLEDFILESNRLANLYGWRTEPEEMKKLDELSDQLDDISEQIKIITELSS
jgi:hypothetical protein